jgi:hypothetical protein
MHIQVHYILLIQYLVCKLVRNTAEMEELGRRIWSARLGFLVLSIAVKGGVVVKETLEARHKGHEKVTWTFGGRTLLAEGRANVKAELWELAGD